jgi:hypothetical protein
VWIVPLLAILTAAGEGPEQHSLEAGQKDSTPVAGLRRPNDSVVLKPSSASSPQPAYRSPPWSWELAPKLGVLAVDFPQKANFVTDLSSRISNDQLVLRQPFPGSDLAWTAGFDGFVRHADVFRLVLGAGWSSWSAQAIAGKRDSLVQAAQGRDSLTYRSYSSDLWTGEVGFDILIPRRILTVDASRDAFLGFRYRQGVGRLEGRTTAWGWTFGESFLLGADILGWKQWGLSGILGWNSVSSRSNKNWSDVLWDSPAPGKVNWDGGGLSLEFQLRWGIQRDTTSVVGVQKK